MKKIFGIILFFGFVFIQTSLHSQNAKIEWLKGNCIPVRSLNDTLDFSDLQPLKEILKDKEIVMLGESTHSDGSTFEAKNRLIRFLHQELDFDVLIFESGFYESIVIDSMITLGVNPIDAAKMGFFMWPYAKQSRAIFTYVAETKKSKNPMSLAGMDCKVGTGTSTAKAFLSYFYKTLDAFAINQKVINVPVFNACIEKLWKDAMSGKPKGDTLQIFTSDLDSLSNLFFIKSKSDNCEIAGFWAQTLKSMKKSLDAVWYFDRFKVYKLFLRLNTLYSIRDIQNADNLEWLIEHRFKGKKVIVWAATAHLLHNLKSIKVHGFKSLMFNFRNFDNVGDIIWKKYKEKSYTIGFTSFEGEKESVISSKKIRFKNDSKRSIEYLLNKLDQNYLFIDFSKKELPKWIKGKMKSSIVGYGNEISVIPNTLDGLFFCKKMKIVEY